MKKALFISYYFLPSSVGAAQRVLSFAKYSKRIKSYVLCPEKIDAIYVDSLNQSISDDVIIKRVPSLSLSFFRKAKSTKMKNEEKSNPFFSFVFSFLRLFLYPDKGVFWLRNAIKVGVKMIKDEGIDKIVSTSPLFSNHIIAYFIKKRTNCKWVCDIRDLHYIYHREDQFSPFKLLDKIIEKKVLRKADCIVLISKEMELSYIERYPFIKGKTSVVINGYDHKELNIAKSTPLKKHHVLYAGNFYNGKGNPEALVSSLSYLVDNNLIDRDEIIIEIIGHIEKDLAISLKGYTLFNEIIFHGPKPREEVHKKMKEANLLWLITPDFRFLREGFPLKGYEYIAAGNKILAYVPKVSMSASIINTTQTGIVLSDEMDKKTIKENALKILTLMNDENFSPNLGEIQKYTREKQALIMENIIIDL